MLSYTFEAPRSNNSYLLSHVHVCFGRCMDFLAESIKKTGANEPYGIEPFIFALTFDVLGESSFSQDFGVSDPGTSGVSLL